MNDYEFFLEIINGTPVEEIFENGVMVFENTKNPMDPNQNPIFYMN